MKIKVFSWLLAATYALSGILLFVVIPKFEAVFSEAEVSLPALRVCLKKELIHNPVDWVANISELLFDTISLKNEFV